VSPIVQVCVLLSPRSFADPTDLINTPRLHPRLSQREQKRFQSAASSCWASVQRVWKRHRQSYDTGHIRNHFSVSPHCTLSPHVSELSTVLRLHVNIFDQSAQQFTLPSEYFDLPKPELECLESADLQFHYDPSPFAFWITRRSDPGSVPIFDTRLTSLPSPPIPAFVDGFPLVFEDRYLQVPRLFISVFLFQLALTCLTSAHVVPSTRY